MSRYKLIIPKSVFKEIEKLDLPLKRRIRDALLALRENPFPPGKRVKRLKGPYDEFWRLRVGDYRVMYEVEGGEVRILGIVHRKDLEKWLRKKG